MILFKLDLITARLASLASGGTVAHIGIAATEDAAIARGSSASPALFIVPFGEASETLTLGGNARILSSFGVITIVRTLQNAAAGGSVYQSIVEIREAVGALLVPSGGWKPSGYERVRWTGGELVTESAQSQAWLDRYQVQCNAR